LPERKINMKIKSVRKITDFRYLNLFSIQYTDQVNNEKQWIFASRSSDLNPLEKDYSRPDAVVIVPFHAEKRKWVVIKEFRLAIGGYQYGFPAGLVDKGESVDQAAGRELFEETGLSLTKIVRKSPAVFSSSGMTDESVCLLFVECEGEPCTKFNEPSEDIEVLLVSADQAARMIEDPGNKFDVKTWIVLNSIVCRETM
jgi:ADP-ribose pyrophosphatase